MLRWSAFINWTGQQKSVFWQCLPTLRDPWDLITCRLFLIGCQGHLPSSKHMSCIWKAVTDESTLLMGFIYLFNYFCLKSSFTHGCWLNYWQSIIQEQEMSKQGCCLSRHSSVAFLNHCRQTRCSCHSGPIVSAAFVPSGSHRPVAHGNNTPSLVCLRGNPIFTSHQSRCTALMLVRCIFFSFLFFSF